MFLFPAELGLHYCGGVLSIFCVGFSLRWLLLLQSTGSRACGHSSSGSQALEHRLSSCGNKGLVTPRHVGSSQIRDRTHISYIGRQILSH